jgi:hypothetical protein
MVPWQVRPFEPERSHPAPPDAFDRKAFFDAGIGLLVEQGNVENARVLLGRRAASHPQDSTVYLDAIRAERTAAPEARAWEAWLERALRGGVDVADEARRLLPRAPLQAFLARSELSWKVLRKQPSSTDARELLRLRLEGLLLGAPQRALDELEQPEMASAAASDPALRALGCAVLCACALQHAQRVATLLPRYADPTPAAGEADVHLAAVVARLALAPAWCAIEADSAWPKPLARFVTLGSVSSVAAARRLRTALDHDLRAQPREYLRCADSVVERSAALFQALRDEARAVCGEPATDTTPSELEEASTTVVALGADARADAAIERALRAIETSVPSAAMRLADLGGQLLGWPLGRALDRVRYRHTARPLCAALLARDGVGARTLCTRLAAAPRSSLRRLARPLRADAALELLHAWADAAAGRVSD